MWKWLHPYAKTERAYQLCLTLQPWFWVGALACLSVGTVWGLAFAPQDYQQGDSFRIIYIHVPSAILSMGTYVAMAIAALVGMVWQWRTAYMSMIAMAPIGAVMTFIALFTGGRLVGVGCTPNFRAYSAFLVHGRDCSLRCF